MRTPDVPPQLRVARANWLSKCVQILANPVYCVSVYLVYLLLRQIAVVSEYLVVVQYFLVIWAYALIAYALLRKRAFFQVAWLKILVLLLPAAVITLAVNIHVNPVMQIKSGILLAISVLIFYPAGAQIARSPRPPRELAKAILPAQIITAGQALVTLLMLLTGYSFMGEINGVHQHLGVQSFTYGDKPVFLVFGMNVDSNHAALFGLFALLVTTWAYVYRKKIFNSERACKIYTVFYWIDFVLQFFAIPLYNSRGSRVALTVVLIIAGIWLVTFYYRRSEYLRRRAKAGVAIVGIAAVGVAVVGSEFAMDAVMDSGLKYYSAVFSDAQHQNNAKLDEDVTALQFDKGDATKSARVYIWGETLALWQNHKAVGVGPYNTAFYAKADGLQTERAYLERGVYVHNSYLDVLISYGALGFALYVVFFIGYAVTLGKRFRAWHTDWADIILLSAALLVMCGVMFLTDSFLGLDYMFGLLLVLMGFLVSKPAADEVYLPVLRLRPATVISV